MDVEFTKHAEDMLKERKFDRAFIVDVVCIRNGRNVT